MHPRRRRLIVLGSTGSIGVNTLAVVDHLHRIGAASFEVVGLAAGSNHELLCEQAQTWSVKAVALAECTDPNAIRTLREFGQFLTGPDAAVELIDAVAQPGDLVVGAIVGVAGLPAIVRAIERGCDIALANKETLVAAGAIVMPLVRERGVSLIPVDSEHSAVFQCMQAGRTPQEVQRVILTASGGPFRTWSAERLARATIEEALNHPTWSMGDKVTIDSASLMNKALEVIEAHWLFDLPAEKIDVLVHPQSIVHSLVEFVDGSVIAQMNPPDMKLPIQYALTWPDRRSGSSRALNLADVKRLEFEAVDAERFPAIGLAEQAITRGGNAGAVLNAANEAAVDAFRRGRITFDRIARLVAGALETVPANAVRTLDDCLDADRAAREWVDAQLETSPPRAVTGRGDESSVSSSSSPSSSSSRAAAVDPLSRGATR